MRPWNLVLHGQIGCWPTGITQTAKELSEIPSQYHFHIAQMHLNFYSSVDYIIFLYSSFDFLVIRVYMRTNNLFWQSPVWCYTKSDWFIHKITLWQTWRHRGIINWILIVLFPSKALSRPFSLKHNLHGDTLWYENGKCVSVQSKISASTKKEHYVWLPTKGSEHFSPYTVVLEVSE